MAPEIIQYEVRSLFVEEVNENQVLAPKDKPIVLSKAQYETYSFITDFHRNNGFPPTVRQIMEYRGEKSTGTVSSRIRKLGILGCVHCAFNDNDILVGYAPIAQEGDFVLRRKKFK